MRDWSSDHYSEIVRVLGTAGLLGVCGLAIVRLVNGPIEPNTSAEGWYVLMALVVVFCFGSLFALVLDRRRKV